MTQEESTRLAQRKAEVRYVKKGRHELRPNIVRPFVGIDGEGGNDGRKHHYYLLRAGDRVLETGKPLDVWECLDFLTSLPKGPIYVSYFFDYDTTQILRALPRDILAKLLDRPISQSSRGTVEVGNGYWVGYLPRKELRIRRGNSGPYTIVNDVGTFFQCRFLSALEDWGIGTPTEREDIRRGKDQRAEFGIMTEEIRRYNGLEIRLLGELMVAFRKACREAGYMPSMWQGPGCLANAMMRVHSVPKRKMVEAAGNIPDELWHDANDAYYGGRFELTSTGIVKDAVSQWDINSAYPAAMLDLPCLIHGEWRYHESEEGGLSLISDSDLWLAWGEFQETEDAWLYGLPVRKNDGTITFPARGNGWYWSVEIAQAKHQNLNVKKLWYYVRHCDCKPFEFLPEIYNERKRIGKSGKGKVLKLGMNSLYGKTAQSIGKAPYANPIWASLITAMTRAKMMSKVHEGPLCGNQNRQCGKDVYMLATDGLFRDARMDVLAETSAVLGEWEYTLHKDGIFLVQPGLYYCEGAEAAKTRGLPRQRFMEYMGTFRERWIELEWKLMHGEPIADEDWRVSVPVQSYVGLRLARMRNWNKVGEWDHKCDGEECGVIENHVHKYVSFQWKGKREEERGYMEEGPVWHSAPQVGTVDTVNYPYDKHIGAWRDEERLVDEDNPDWGISL